MRCRLVVVAALAASSLLVVPAHATGSAAPRRAAGHTVPGRYDWPMYGHDAHHTFHGRTTLGPATIGTLVPKWFFRTGDAVTANPVVVAGTVYVGSWDGTFYAIDASDGTPRWTYRVKSQPSVVPDQNGRRPGSVDDLTSDGGIITSSATFVPGAGDRPDLVVFGGGYTLYALRAADGALAWAHDYTGRPDRPPDPVHDEARIFSSPAVVDGQVIVGVSSDGQRDHRGYVVSADLATGRPRWVFETDVDAAGRPRNDGCGGVWASPTIDETDALAVVDVADCHFRGTAPYDERVLALRIADGTLAWTFTPPRLVAADPDCDWDFGATANLGRLPGGRPFLGVGGKDGYYYALDPATGRLRWQTRVVFGGLAGGFIGTTAFDGVRVYGATALGDFGRFEGVGRPTCQPANPQDQLVQEPSIHAFDARTGRVVWQGELSQSFGPTTVAGGMTFVGTGITRELQVRDASNGSLLAVVPLPAPSDSGAVVAGDTVYVGTGSSEQGIPDGVVAFAPSGTRGTATSAPRW